MPELDLYRFSDHFDLNRSQAELDFVDIPLDTDIRLCVDPYALHVAQDPWFVECNNLVVNYFEFLIELLLAGDDDAAYQVLSHLHEPNDARLGLSRGLPRGRGVGANQAAQLLVALQTSRALQAGQLNELSDCELLIPGIGPDKISDVTINIIRGKLIDYTQSQCLLHDVPMRSVAAGMYWDGNDRLWKTGYADLPVYKNGRLILTPKLAIRRRLAVDHREYYEFYVLEYLQAEHLEANTALVEVLRNGTRRVTKTRLKERHPLRQKEFLYQFTEKHPEVLKEYKADAAKSEQNQELSDEQVEESQQRPRQINIGHLISDLDSIPPGNADAHRYHEWVISALTCIFKGSLRNPVKEQEVHSGIKRIDIFFTNRASRGFFSAVSSIHNIQCPYVPFECKNYSRDVANPEFDQLRGRFNTVRGEFGVMVCRSVADHDRMIQRCKAVVNDRHGFIIVLVDEDMKELLRLRVANDLDGIDDYLDGKLSEVLM